MKNPLNFILSDLVQIPHIGKSLLPKTLLAVLHVFHEGNVPHVLVKVKESPNKLVEDLVFGVRLKDVMKDMV